MTTTVVNVMLMGDDGVDDVMDLFCSSLADRGSSACAPTSGASLALAEPGAGRSGSLVLGTLLSLAEPGAGRAWRHLRHKHGLGLERLRAGPQHGTLCFVVGAQLLAAMAADGAMAARRNGPKWRYGRTWRYGRRYFLIPDGALVKTFQISPWAEIRLS